MESDAWTWLSFLLIVCVLINTTVSAYKDYLEIRHYKAQRLWMETHARDVLPGG